MKTLDKFNLMKSLLMSPKYDGDVAIAEYFFLMLAAWLEGREGSPYQSPLFKAMWS